MKYKTGDRVKIKSLDWYNENKDKYGIVYINHDFIFYASKYCGKVLTISKVLDNSYLVKEDNEDYYWTDEMIEGLVEPIDCKKCGLIYMSTRCLFMDNCPHNKQKNIMEEKTKVGTALNPIEPKSNANCITQESIDELVKDEILIERVDDSGLPFNEWLSHKGAFYIPDGYELKDEKGNVINTTKIVLEKKKKEYPKSYEECCKVLDFCGEYFFTTYEEGTHLPENDNIVKIHPILKSVSILTKLLICRNAYWKLYGEEMGLGKPWEPDWNDERQDKYGFYNECKYTIINSATFVFPTAEMRDAFYENFKEEIEICKELL